MGRESSKSRLRSPRITSGRWLLAILCMLLVLLGTTLQVAHSHSDNLSHADCALCATAHVVAHVIATPAAPAAVMLVGIVPCLLPLPSAHAISTFALFTRPPPPSLTLA
ncbi:MAG TPA: hypothetical protein VNW54_06115 [Granulicella sp.]|jgi:hypothetical protein|nr:hypothetical protein [Granulicella sp.]